MFSSSRPVVAAAFYDREDALAQLSASLAALRAGQPRWIALIGRRKVGKTSLLLELARRTTEAHGSDVRFILVDVLEESPVSLEVFRLLGLRTLDAFLGTAAARSFEALATDHGAYRAALAPQLAQVPPEQHGLLLELPSVPLTAAVLRQVLQLPQVLATHLGGQVVLALDEFQELMVLPKRGRRDPIEPVALLRSVWQRHDRVAYIVSGSSPSMLKRLVSDRASPFFQHLTMLELGEMARPDAVAMLVANGLGPALAERCYDVLGGHPFYLQLLGEQLEELGGDPEAFNEAVQRLLFSATGRLALYLEREHQRAVGQAAEMAAVLTELAASGADGRRVGELSRILRISTGSASKYLDRLGDLVEVTADGAYRVEDRALRLWISWRGPNGAAVPPTVLGDEAERAVARSFAVLGFELVYQSRASRGAFDLLAVRAATLLGVQVKRHVLPLSFSAAAWARMEADAARFGWRWVVAAVDPTSGEVRFLDPARARVGKTVRLAEEASIVNLLAWLEGR